MWTKIKYTYTQAVQKITDYKIYLYHNVLMKDVLYYKNHDYVNKNIYQLPVLWINEKNIHRIPGVSPGLFRRDYLYKCGYTVYRKSPGYIYGIDSNETYAFGMHCVERDLDEMLRSPEHFRINKNSLHYKRMIQNYEFILDLNMATRKGVASLTGSLGADPEFIEWYVNSTGFLVLTMNGIKAIPVDLKNKTGSGSNIYGELLTEYYYYLGESLSEKTLNNKKITDYSFEPDPVEQGNRKAKTYYGKNPSSLTGFQDVCNINDLYLLTGKIFEKNEGGDFLLRNVLNTIVSSTGGGDQPEYFVHVHVKKIAQSLNNCAVSMGYNPLKSDHLLEEVNDILSIKFSDLINFNGLFKKYVGYNQQYIPFNSHQSILEVLKNYSVETTGNTVLIKNINVGLVFSLFADVYKVRSIIKKLKSSPDFIYHKLADRNETVYEFHDLPGTLLDVDTDLVWWWGKEKEMYRGYFLCDNLLCMGMIMHTCIDKARNPSYTPIINSRVEYHFTHNGIKFYSADHSVKFEKL